MCVYMYVYMYVSMDIKFAFRNGVDGVFCFVLFLFFLFRKFIGQMEMNVLVRLR